MPIVASEGGSSPIPLIEAATHAAVCVAIVDVGTHVNPTYGKAQRIVYIAWEFPDEPMVTWVDKETGENHSGPRLKWKRYTLTLGTAEKPSNLRRDLTSWRGREFSDEERKVFDLERVLNAPCMITIVHETASSGKVYDNIGAIVRLPKGMQPPKPSSKPVYFSLDDYLSSDDVEPVSAKIPPWLAERTLKSEEWSRSGRTLGGADDSVKDVAAFSGDDIPF